ncbi:hypothetical protein IAU59_007048 [Kwoniella sp. CBS 9459]
MSRYHQSQTVSGSSQSQVQSNDWKIKYEQLHQASEAKKKAHHSLEKLYSRMSLEKDEDDSRVKELEARQAEMERQLEESENERSQMEKRMEEMEETHQAYTDEQVRLVEGRITSEYEERLRLAKAECQDLKSELKGSKSKLKQSALNVCALEQQVREAKENLQLLTKECDEQAREIKQLRDNLGALSHQGEGDKLEIRWLSDEKKRLVKEGEKAQTALNQYKDCFGEFYESDTETLAEEEQQGQEPAHTDVPPQEKTLAAPEAPLFVDVTPGNPGVQNIEVVPDAANLTANVHAADTRPITIGPLQHSATSVAVDQIKPHLALLNPPKYCPKEPSKLTEVPGTWPEKRQAFSPRVTTILNTLRVNSDASSGLRLSRIRYLKPFKYEDRALDSNQRLRWSEIIASIPDEGLTPEKIREISQSSDWGIIRYGQDQRPIVEPEVIRWSCLHDLVCKEVRRRTPDIQVLSALLHAEHTSYYAIMDSGLPQFTLPTKREPVETNQTMP